MTALTYPDGRLPCLNDSLESPPLQIPAPYFTCPETRDELARLYSPTPGAPATPESASAITPTLKRRSCGPFVERLCRPSLRRRVTARRTNT